MLHSHHVCPSKLRLSLQLLVETGNQVQTSSLASLFFPFIGTTGIYCKLAKFPETVSSTAILFSLVYTTWQLNVLWEYNPWHRCGVLIQQIQGKDIILNERLLEIPEQLFLSLNIRAFSLPRSGFSETETEGSNIARQNSYWTENYVLSPFHEVTSISKALPIKLI